MVTDYLSHLKLLWFHCPDFYEQALRKADGKAAIRFAVLTSLLVAVEIGLAEALSGGALTIVALVTGVLLACLPFASILFVHLWSLFVRLCGVLLGETLPSEQVWPIVAYSLGGLVALGLGFGLGGVLALAIFFFQFIGFQKVLGYSRWQAAVYVGFPFSLVAVMGIIFTLLFKVFK